jgi:hypothetical protein
MLTYADVCIDLSYSRLDEERGAAVVASQVY